MTLKNIFFQPLRLREILIIGCSGALIAIWPLPESIAFRHIFLIIGSLASFSYLLAQRKTIFIFSSWPFWSLFAFFGWILIHLAVFSHELDLQISELQSTWLRSFLAMTIGLALGLLLTNSESRPSEKGSTQQLSNYQLDYMVSTWLLLCLSATAFIFCGRYLYEVFITREWLHFNFYMTPYKAKMPLVICGALALPLCFILTIKSIQNKCGKSWIPLFILCTGLILFSIYFANTKNGIAIFVIALAFFVVNLMLNIHWKMVKSVTSIIAVAILLVASYYGIEKHALQNPAWSNLISNIKTGVDIDNQQFWKNSARYPIPNNEMGNQVDASTYERTAWFLAGARLLKDNPQGFGLIHHSFGWLALKKWPDFYPPNGKTRGATHSGWMDMALGVGIPGILLIIIPLAISWLRSLFQKGLWFSYATWTIPLMTFAYLTTEVAGAHFTELLFFMTAFFCGLTLQFPITSAKMREKFQTLTRLKT